MAHFLWVGIFVYLAKKILHGEKKDVGTRSVFLVPGQLTLNFRRKKLMWISDAFASSFCLKLLSQKVILLSWWRLFGHFKSCAFRNNQDPSLIISPGFVSLRLKNEIWIALSGTGPEKKPAISAVCVSLVYSCSARNLLIRKSKTNTVVVMCVFTESCLQTAVSQWTAMKKLIQSVCVWAN